MVRTVYPRVSVAALALLLVAAFMHAGWNFFAKGARNNDLTMQCAFVAVSAVVYLPVALITLLFFDPRMSWAGFGFAAVSSLIHLLYFALLGRAYATGDLSLVYPLARGTGPLLAVFGAVVLLGEEPGVIGVVGTLMIVGGILTMSWSSELRSVRGAGVAVAFALATGATTAVYTLWDKQGVERLSPVLYSYTLDVGRLVVVAPLVLFASRGFEGVRGVFADPVQRRAAIAIGVLSPGAYLLVLVALAIAPASYVAPAREVSVLIGALLGVGLLRESNPRRRIGGAALIVAGIVALTIGA
jgi:drug/metabolite transporter (DMT)-like permease